MKISKEMTIGEFAAMIASYPLSIGDELVQAESELDFKGYKLKLLSPTQSVMDRLAAYFHWNDLQCLDQAVWIAEKQPVRIHTIREWAKREGEADKFNDFVKLLQKK